MSDAGPGRDSTCDQLAVLGGSFDPPHVGHVLLAAYALSVARVERVLIVPTFAHALGKPLTKFEHRLRMCEIAFSPLRNVEISPIERDLGGTSRTLRLLLALEQRYPGRRLRLLIGADILHEASRWQAFDEVRRRAPLLVAGRAGYEHPDVDPRAPRLADVSSTAVRQALACGDDVSTWVPAGVIDYLETEKLYRGATGS